MSVGLGADPGFLAVSPQVTVINPVVGCCYFPPGPRLLSQSKRSPPRLVPNYTASWQRHISAYTVKFKKSVLALLHAKRIGQKLKTVLFSWKLNWSRRTSVWAKLLQHYMQINVLYFWNYRIKAGSYCLL